MPEPNRLRDRVAIVTGAAGGLGRATVELLHVLGASVVAEDADPGVERLGAIGDRVATIRGDVRERQTATAAVALALGAFGSLDILVNNAAVIRSTNILETSEAEWDEVMAVNVKGPFHHVRAALPHMLKRGHGSIVNVTSISGVVGLPKQAAYCAS
jgi:NAD(P)-dependent dehydrogenase (short-subunit alcohol dehydrogenase family)